MSDNTPCTICGNPAKREGDYLWNCVSCGLIDFHAFNPNCLSETSRVKISAFLRERKLSGIYKTVILECPAVAIATEYAVTLEEALDKMDRIFDSPMERINRTLIGIGKSCQGLGRQVIITHPYMAYAEDYSAMHFVIGAMAEAGYIRCNATTREQRVVTLTVAGYNKIAEIQGSKSTLESDTGFIARWFNSCMDEAGGEIEHAIESCDYVPMCVKSSNDLGKICEEIIAKIRKSRFVVADFTGHRAGVYFEAGYAMGLGIPVIMTVHEKDLDIMHFDLRQYRQIVWKDPVDLRNQLQVSIEVNVPKPRRQ